MPDNKTYLTSELVSVLGLPRSTVADWLKLYAPYLESENRGRRKVYAASALDILREIAAWRAEGRSGMEIEKLLAEKYGLRPEIARSAGTGNAVSGAEISGNGSAGRESEAEEEEGGGGGAASALPVRSGNPLLPENPAELDKLVEYFRRAETERRRSSGIRWILFWTIGLLAAVLLLTGYFFARRMVEQLIEENRISRRQMAEKAAEQLTLQQKQGETLAGMEEELEKRHRDYEAHLDRLRSELSDQRRAFAEELKKLEADAGTREEARLLALKNEFARIQKEKLRELEKLSGELAESRRREESLRAEHRAEMENMRRKLEASETRAAAAAAEKATEKTAAKPALPSAPAAGKTPAGTEAK